MRQKVVLISWFSVGIKCVGKVFTQELLYVAFNAKLCSRKSHEDS